MQQECSPRVRRHLPVCLYSSHRCIMGLDFYWEVQCSLGYFIKKLPYYILSVQPIVAEDKTGFFTRLGCFLEEKIERGDKLEKI